MSINQTAMSGGAFWEVVVKFLLQGVTTAVASLVAFVSIAADYPTPKEGDWIGRNFRFHTGEVMPELRLHYTTVGERTGEPVLILHGTMGSGTGMLTPNFAGKLLVPVNL
jgi:homoserine O-acetyltransferase